MAKRD
jgi:multiple sugar transport system substrate-binding protein